MEKLKRRDHFGDEGVDERIILKMDFKEVCYECVAYIQMAQDRGLWWALVNTVMKLKVQ
jgi:hypothetical protein